MKLVVRRHNNALHPADDLSWEVFDKLPRDKLLSCEVWVRGRNPEFLSRYWAVLSVAADHHDDWDDRSDVDHWVRLRIPMTHTKYTIGTDVVIELRSIAIDAMSVEDFETFYEKAMALLSEKIGSDVESLAEAAWERQKGK